MDGNGLVLRVVRGTGTPDSRDVRGGPVTIGSWPGATLALEGESLQPVHVVLDPERGGRWRLLALAPEGCRVNGRLVRRALVAPGDRLTVGPYDIELDARGARMAPPAELPLRVRVFWGDAPLDARVLAPGTPLDVGRGAGVELPPSLLAPGAHRDVHRWVVATCLDGRWHVALDTPLRALDARHGQPLLTAAPRTDGPPAAAGCGPSLAWAPLAGADRVRMEAGGFALELERCRVASPERRPVQPWWTSREGQGSIVVALIALFFVGILRIPTVAPFEPAPLSGPVREVLTQFRPPAKTLRELERERLERARADNRDGASAKARGEEGRAGRPDAPARPARRAGPLSDEEIVRRQALLRALEASGRATAQLLSGGALAAAGAVGNLRGPQVGDASGMLGLGLRGDGAGGGGAAADTVGTGPVGTRGGAGFDAGAGRLRGTGPSDLTMDEPERVEGGLDREVIRRVILSHRAQIRYCYEKGLSAKPDLAGKVVSEFVIGADGRVTTARTASRTLEESEVPSCIESKIRTWTFPPPKGGGVVVVTYPFLFKPSGPGGT